MYRKFIITSDGVLKFGHVMRHMDLLETGQEDCNGGGLWDIEYDTIILFSRSFDFGAPDFSKLTRIDWSTLDGKGHPLVYYPFWPDRVTAVPIML